METAQSAPLVGVDPAPAPSENSNRSTSAGQTLQRKTPTQLTLAELATVFDNPTAADAIFICVDCEAWEHDQKEVTEIGVAVLDTRDIPLLDTASCDVQKVADLINSKAKYVHYRPVEYAQHINKNWVKGCSDSFGFGQSTWIRLADAAEVLERIFRDPTRLDDAANFTLNIEQQDRTLIFVGHGAGDDVSFMKTLGFSMYDAQGMEATVNTQRLVSWFRTGLEQLLGATGIQAINLHNGGNDAAYTIQAMVKAAVFELHTADCVGKLLQNGEGKNSATTNLEQRAPVTWAGTAVEGDEVKLAIDYKAAKNAAFKRRAIAKKEKDAKREERRAAAQQARQHLAA